MSTCDGNGWCLTQGSCARTGNLQPCSYSDCSDDDCVCANDDKQCNTCKRGGYDCPSACIHDCKGVECRNYIHCGKKDPQFLLDCHRDQCINCDTMSGMTTYTKLVEECCVCYEMKRMVLLKCNHTVCTDCWWSISNVREHRKCPICRKKNDWT